MSLPLWSKYDASMYRALSLFPKNLEGKPLSPSEFANHFKDFFGRPVQDIIEALRHYGQQGYFNFELKLSPEYLEYGNALADVMDKLSGTTPDKYRGLGKPVYDKVLAKRPLTTAEASNLPDSAKSRLTFSLSDIDRQRLNEGLVVYDSGINLPIIRQGKSATKPPLNKGAIKLKPGNYDKHTGVLSLAPFHDRPIAGKAGVKRPGGKKYYQCRVMECVFSSEKKLKHGVEISAILVIKKPVDKSTTKKINNAVSAINNKVADDNGPKNLIKIQKGKVFLNNSYL
jgi:hypothetical protein